MIQVWETACYKWFGVWGHRYMCMCVFMVIQDKNIIYCIVVKRVWKLSKDTGTEDHLKWQIVMVRME